MAKKTAKTAKKTAKTAKRVTKTLQRQVEPKCEDYGKTLNKKITVIGDSWLRLQILSEITSENRKRQYQAPLYAGGASRLFKMIQKATRGEHEIDHLYIPKNSERQLLATGLLQEDEPEGDAYENLCYLGGKLPPKLHRLDQHWGAESMDNLTPTNYAPIVEKPVDGDKYWVICDDCLYSGGSEGYTGDRKELYEKLFVKQFMDTPPTLILWGAERFGNNSFSLEGQNTICKEIILEKANIKEKTVVFLKVEFLNDAGIGERGDSSLEECFQGILEAILEDEKMKDLAGCAAIVIENGVDSAFLIQLEPDHIPPKIKHCEIFFRTLRTCNAYRQGMKSIHFASTIPSCLQALISSESPLPQNNVKDFDTSWLLKGLAEGIKDGLGRLWLQFHIGSPLEKKKNGNNGDIESKYFEDIYDRPIPAGKIEVLLKEIIEIENKYQKENFQKPILLSDPKHRETQKSTIGKLRNDLKNMLVQQYPSMLSMDIEKIIDVFKDIRVHSVKLDLTKHNYVNKTESATYMSHTLRFPKDKKLIFRAPWLLEKQWDDIKGKEKENESKSKEDKSKKDDEYFTGQDEFLYAIVRFGLEALAKRGLIEFPVARFEEFAVVDPEEISIYRRLQNLMRKYTDDPNEKTPLGLAVFGSPGMGKTYGIKKVVDTLKKKTELFECNLAQFTSADNLAKKLLEARSSAWEGRIPVIFLDEFDSSFQEEPFGWFKHLLALLQDGTFRYQGNSYPLGKAFVICAGGLNRSFQEFEWKSRNPVFRNAKIPDLISRLRAHVNIKGPNPYFPFPSENDPYEKPTNQPFQLPMLENYQWFLHQSKKERSIRVQELAEKDPLFKIRRAVIIRNVLKKKMKSIQKENNEFSIGLKVLRALLNISEYKYGTRSIEAVIDMSVSVFRSSRRFVGPMIPLPEQLDIHVDAEEFYERLKG